MKNKTTALLFVLASSALILAGCGKTEASSAGTSSAASSEAASSTPTTSAPASSTSEPASSTSEPASSSSSQEEAKVNVAYADDSFGFGGAGDAGTGKFVYWAGDGGAVSAHSKTDGIYSLTYKAAGNWYGIQLFYKLPYAETGDTYKVSWAINSDAAGDITILGTVYSLVAGDNTVTFDATQGATNTIDAQLGVKSGSLLGGSTFKFATPVIYDTTAGAKYNEVKFVNDTTVVKDIQVKAGKLVTAPADPTPAVGYIFDDWYNGTAEFDAASAVTAATTYTAKFISEADVVRYTVTFYNGATSMGTAQIIKGKKVVVPSALVYPFGYTAMAWYKEVALTNAWNLSSDTVTADVSLYAKLKVTPSTTFMNTAATGNIIPDTNMSTNEDGSLKVSGFAGWAGAAWVVQVNFLPVPATDSTKTYTIGFKYKINGTGADVQVYDGATIGNLVTMNVATEWTAAAITFTGHACSDTSKLTFELGAMPASVTSVEFQLSEITLTVA